MSKRVIEVGDIFEIPLTNNRKAFGQYLYWDPSQGPLIRVFSLIVDSSEDVKIDDIVRSKELFPPIITGLLAAIKKGLWRVIGHSQIRDFVYPGFVSAYWDAKTKKTGMWFLWDGKESVNLGYELPEEYKDLEFLAVHSPYDIPDRIETGKKPYDSLIKNNRF